MANNQTHKIDDNLFEEIKVLYNKGNSFGELADKFQISKATIYKSFIRRNEEIRKHNNRYICDEKYFEIIDTSDKAYILGFIAADGCIYKQRGCHTLSIGIHPKDIEILEFLKNELKSNSNIEISKVSGKYDRALLRIHSAKIVKDLENLGITERKSYTLKFSRIPKDYVSDYLRGYMDGDGHISSKRNEVCLVSSNDFCLEVKNILEENNIECRIHDEPYNITTKKLRLRRKSIVNFMKFLQYNKNNSFSLKRKRQEAAILLQNI